MRIRVEIKCKDSFWGRAFQIEWADRFPDRELMADGARFWLIEPEWLEDVERVAAECRCRLLRAPDDPKRRQLIRGIFGGKISR
jgi:hypothetical protein